MPPRASAIGGDEDLVVDRDHAVRPEAERQDLMEGQSGSGV